MKTSPSTPARCRSGRIATEAIAAALVHGDNLCVEAPTGVGKSFAYLVPLILRARYGGRPAVVSTETIHLQEQLIGHDIPLLRELKKAAGDVPLVLHGGSGTPGDQLAQAIENGIAKINIYHELTAAWNTTMRDFLNQREQMACWFVVACKEPDAAMRKVMREKMRMFRSEGKY